MGNSPLCNGSVSAGVGCKSYFCRPTRGGSISSCEEDDDLELIVQERVVSLSESHAKHEKYASNFEENSTKTKPLEDLEISSSKEEDDLEHLIVQELGVLLSESRVKHEKYASDFEEKSTKTNPLEDLEIFSSKEDDDLEHLIVQELGVSLSESRVTHEKYASDFEEKSTKTNPLKDLEIASSEEDLEHLIVQELGVSLSEPLNGHDNLEPLSVGNLALNQDENFNHQDTNLLLDTATLDGLNEDAIVFHSSVVQPYSSTSDAIEELPCDIIHKDNFAMETPASTCSLPSKKLVSAMKGSREKQGKHLSTKLSVKWAPEVYDPPITSSSRTVKGRPRHHGHKTKKDNHVHRHTKGKTSRASGKKYAHRRSSSSLIDPRILRLQELGARNKREQNTCNSSKMEPSLYTAWRSPEKVTICGSSCHVESITPIPLSVAQ